MGFEMTSSLGGHLKTGQLWTGQNRPVGERPKHECFTPLARERQAPERRRQAENGWPGGMSGYGQARDRGSWALYAARLRRVDASRRVPLAAVEPGAPAAGSARQDMGVVEEAVEERGDGRGITEELAPVLDRTI